MKVYTKLIGKEKAELEINRYLEIEMSNGDIYRFCEDREGMMEITKEYSDDNSRININPRQSNQVCLF